MAHSPARFQAVLARCRINPPSGGRKAARTAFCRAPRSPFQGGEIGGAAGPRQQRLQARPTPPRPSAFRPGRCAGSGSAPVPAPAASISSRASAASSNPAAAIFSSAAMVLVSRMSRMRMGAWTSCSAWAMNSMSINPPGAYFRSQRLSAGILRGDLFAHLARIGENACRHRAPWRQAAADLRFDPRAQVLRRPPPAAPGSAPYAPRSSFRWRDNRQRI